MLLIFLQQQQQQQQPSYDPFIQDYPDEKILTGTTTGCRSCHSTINL